MLRRLPRRVLARREWYGRLSSGAARRPPAPGPWPAGWRRQRPAPWSNRGNPTHRPYNLRPDRCRREKQARMTRGWCRRMAPRGLGWAAKGDPPARRCTVSTRSMFWHQRSKTRSQNPGAPISSAKWCRRKEVGSWVSPSTWPGRRRRGCWRHAGRRPGGDEFQTLGPHLQCLPMDADDNL